MISCETQVASPEIPNNYMNDGFNYSLCRENLASVNFEGILKGSSNGVSSYSNNTENTDAEMDVTGISPEKLNHIQIEVVESYLNCQGNYNTYVTNVLKSIEPISAIEYPNLLITKMRTLPDGPVNKKTLILDLDETLVHADFEGIYESPDQILSFIYNGAEVLVPIILRPGLFEFLVNVSQVFEVVVFTASQREYADAVLNFIDPMGIFFTLRLYREDCIVINNRICIKDLRIFTNRSLKDMLIVDNSMYSFCKQLSNGILINSFYYGKEDRELYNLYNYLALYILTASDVRKVNDEFFNFTYIMEAAYSKNCHARMDTLN